jgi:hypothetical protein
MIRHTRFPTLRATFTRAIAEHRLNRFLHVHLALCAVVSLRGSCRPCSIACPSRRSSSA